MAASTWFQGSACRPSSQGMHPSARCTEAMARAVWSASPAVRTPGTSGGTVDDEALAEERVQCALGQPDGSGPAHDVPDQEAVVLADQPRLVVVRPPEAAQPPVERV